MSNWFDSKSQISESSMTAFGISISTRHSKANEMSEMLMFCMRVAAAGLETSVSSVFYDSNADLCSFELNDVEPFSEKDLLLASLAKKTISQYEWNGTIGHGYPLYADEDDSF